MQGNLLSRMTSLASATLLAAAMSATAQAQMPESGAGAQDTPAGGGVGSPEFQKMDKNQDGAIDKKEANRSLKKKWSSVDLDKDDQVSYGEFARFEAQEGSEESSPSNRDEGSRPSSPSPMLP